MQRNSCAHFVILSFNSMYCYQSQHKLGGITGRPGNGIISKYVHS